MTSNRVIRLQAALVEMNMQLQIMSSRAQQLAADLFEANQLNEALSQQITEEQSEEANQLNEALSQQITEEQSENVGTYKNQNFNIKL